MKIETTLEEMELDSNWNNGVFGDDDCAHSGDPKRPEAAVIGATINLSPLELDNVVEVLGSVDGENDCDDWVAVLRMNDGRFSCIRAGCDYTGWD